MFEISAEIHRNLRGFHRKKRAHFRRASHRTITKIILIYAGRRRGPSVDRLHDLKSLRVRGALIYCQNRCKIARFVPKNSEKIRATRRRTHANSCGTSVKTLLECFLRQSAIADVFAKILQALRARCVRNFCRNSSKSVRFSSEKMRALSARIAPHDHQNHSHRCRASAWTFSRPFA